MALTYVASQELFEVSVTSPQTTAINVGTRTNGGLIVLIWGLGSATHNDDMAATYAGSAMTNRIHWNTEANDWFFAFDIVAADCPGFDDSDDLVLTWTFGGGGNWNILYWVATWVDDINQATPYDKQATNSGATDPTVNITPTAADSLIMGFYKSEANNVLTPDGETKTLDEDFGTRVAGGSYVIQPGGPALQTVNWTGTDDDNYCFALAYAPDGGAPSLSIPVAMHHYMHKVFG